VRTEKGRAPEDIALPADPFEFRFSRRLVGRAAVAAATAILASRCTRAAAPTVDGDATMPVPVPAQAPATEGFAELPDGRLWYWDTGGGGEAIVLLHPNSGSALTWPYQQPVFARAGYRVVAYSRRGHHRSSPVPPENPGSGSTDLHAIVDWLGLGAFHLVAAAGGCSHALDYAHSHPERLSSVVLCGGRGGIDDEEYQALTTSLLPEGFEQMPPEFRELGPSYRAANPDGVRAWVEQHGMAVTGNREGQEAVNRVTWMSLGGLRVPVLLMTGDADLYIPPSLLRSFAAAIPGSEMMLFPEAGHAIYWEQPERFNRAVLDFLARH
jgi:pimeloyl-ACP methyl ester carboxylesterase